jgi:hypothetical protein
MLELGVLLKQPKYLEKGSIYNMAGKTKPLLSKGL